MKFLPVLMVLLFSCSSVRAVVINFDVFLHRVDKEVRVEVFSDIIEMDRSNLTVQEAVLFIKTWSRGRVRNEVRVFATTGCNYPDYNPVLRTILDSAGEGTVLTYFEVGNPWDQGSKPDLVKRIKQAGLMGPP